MLIDAQVKGVGRCAIPCRAFDLAVLASKSGLLHVLGRLLIWKVRTADFGELNSNLALSAI